MMQVVTICRFDAVVVLKDILLVEKRVESIGTLVHQFFALTSFGQFV